MEGERSMKFWIGTSGFQYPEWKGTFYPEDLSTAKMLPFYAERFPTTENFGFVIRTETGFDHDIARAVPGREKSSPRTRYHHTPGGSGPRVAPFWPITARSSNALVAYVSFS